MRGLLYSLVLALSTPAVAWAAPIQTYKDSDGVVHLTNVKGGRSHGKSRGGSRSPTVPMGLLEPVVKEQARFYNLPVALVKAVMSVESNYNPWAVSEKGAVGLMQLMPATAKELGVDPYDPVQNIQGGARYLRILVNEFDGDLFKVLSAYNAGPEIVRKIQAKGEFTVPDIPETREYVRRVLHNYDSFKGDADVAEAAVSSPERS